MGVSGAFTYNMSTKSEDCKTQPVTTRLLNTHVGLPESQVLLSKPSRNGKQFAVGAHHQG